MKHLFDLFLFALLLFAQKITNNKQARNITETRELKYIMFSVSEQELSVVKGLSVASLKTIQVSVCGFETHIIYFHVFSRVNILDSRF